MTEPALVAAAVATLWTAPGRARGVDAPMVSGSGDCRAWTSAMTGGERQDLHDRVESQLLLGDRVLVGDVDAGWARVLVPGQAAGGRDPRGYPGWVPVDQIASGEHPGEGPEDVVVDALTTPLRSSPSGEVAVADVVLGTRLPALGAATDGWLPVSAPGRTEPLWVRVEDVRPADGPAAGRASPLAVATRLLGTPYVWGGMTPFGIDCSGLVHLAHRLAGVVVPRNADEQQAAAVAVPLGTEKPGDLYFFAREGGRAHHVGFATGDGWMIDACPVAGRVERQRLSPDRRRTLAGCGRFDSPEA
ncbi:MAG TPA: C40 family peptidase [Rugosimonospora sp.]